MDWKLERTAESYTWRVKKGGKWSGSAIKIVKQNQDTKMQPVLQDSIFFDFKVFKRKGKSHEKQRALVTTVSKKRKLFYAKRCDIECESATEKSRLAFSDFCTKD